MTRERRRTVLLVVLGALAAGIATPLASARRSARSHEARWPGLVAEQRAAERAVRVPVVHGPALPGNATTLYRDLLPRVDRALRDDWWDLKVGPDPFAPIESATQAALASHSEALVGLREALRRERCDWEADYDLPLEQRVLPFELHGLGNLLVADGHRRAQEGDAEGAAACYLDAVRFRADLSRARALLGGTTIALEALGRLVSSDRSRALDLVAVEERLGRALGAHPGPLEELAQLRLEVLGALLRAGSAPDPARALDLSVAWWLDHPVAGRALTFGALHGFDERWAVAERAVRAGDVEALAVDREELHHHGWGQGNLLRLPVWNPVSVQLDSSMAVGLHDELLTREALRAMIRAVCALERAHPLGTAAPAPPEDPFTLAPLTVELRPDGYRVSSPGRPRPGCMGGPGPRSFERRW